MKKVRNIILALLAIVATLIVIFNMYQYVCINLLHKELATLNGYAVLEVVSGSMEPTIHIGDLIVIDTKTKEFKEQDIVTFRDVNGSFVTHRIISLKENEMITKGDYNKSDDGIQSIDTIIGKYKFKISGLGILMTSLKKPFSMFMIFVIGILLCIFVSLDKDGNVILNEEEKEYQEFLNYQKNKKKQSKEIKLDKKKSEIGKIKKLNKNRKEEKK